jgi:hypothetical protein
VANPGQEDADADGVGDPCDEESSDADCVDGLDNDGDGLVDTDDPDCPVAPPPGTCEDGADNDGDGPADAADSECTDPLDGVEDGSDVIVVPTSCTDGLDNDGDGPSDAADSECTDPDDGEEDGSDVTEPPDGSCATGGAADGGATIAEQVAGPGLDESGQLSSQIHAQEGQAGPAGAVVHEAGCVAAALEGQQPPAAPEVPPAPEVPEVPPPS